MNLKQNLMVSALPVRDIFLQQDNQAVAITYLIVRYNIIPPAPKKQYNNKF